LFINTQKVFNLKKFIDIGKKVDIAVKKSIMSLKKIAKKVVKGHLDVDSLLNIIGLSVFEDIVTALNADKWVIKYKTMTIFKLVLYSTLESERLSLRVMERHAEDPMFEALLAEEQQGGISYTNIRNRLQSINPAFFKKAYEQTAKALNTHFSSQEIAGFNLKRYDSTMICTFSHLLSGMQVGNTSKNKTQVKFVTELSNDFEVRMNFFKDQAHLSEETALAEMINRAIHSEKDLIVFDRGLKSRKTFVHFDKSGINFVTRLADSARFKFIELHTDVSQLEEDDKLIFVQDSIVHLYGDGAKLVEHPFRLIEMVRKSDKIKIILLTNLTDKKDEPPRKDTEPDIIYMTTEQIATIYKHRWDIEVLFRFLKQEMNLTHFVSNNTNAIMAMIYCSLILSMLILVYKKVNCLGSYKIAKLQFSQDLRNGILLEIMEDPVKMMQFKEAMIKFKRKI
jgi:Transposase DDE domain